MNVKDFERFLELKSLDVFKRTEEQKNEYYDLKGKLEDVLYGNNSNTDKIIVKLKDALSSWKYSISFNKPNETLNEIKIIKEIMSLLDMYDWRLKYREYILADEHKIEIWEENGEGNTRNKKVWNVK